MNPAAEAATPKACPSCGKRYTADALFCSFDGAPLTTTPGAVAAAAATDAYVGRDILGHIELRQLVGIGAMGKVYRAFQKGIDRDVAVKILHRELSANQTLVARFHREAKVAACLSHPNVVHVLLTGQLPDGAMYIVMEYLDGLSLQSALAAAGGALPLPRTLHVALQLCDAAGEAHAQGIVHRDLKPENVMLVTRSDDPDHVKVLDFGIARLNWGEQSIATAVGLIFGTARYISPEGAQGEKVGPPGDVYSIATIVYQMLAGRSPFDAENAVALLVQQIHDAPRELRSLAPDVPDPIASVVMRNLSKKPEERAPDARAFGRSLLEAAVASGLSAQDVLARPGMLGGAARQSHAPTKTAYVAPDSASMQARPPVKTEIAEPEPQSPGRGAATTKWLPPADFGAKLVPAAPAGLVPPPPPSGVDLTMDDQPAAQPTAPPSRAPSVRAPAIPPAPARETGIGRSMLVIAACFVLGAAGAGLIASRAGLLSSRHRAPRPPAAAQSVALQDDSPRPTPGESTPAPDDTIPPLAVLRSAASSSPVAAAPARVALEVSSARPAVGQPVDLVGRVAGARARVEGGRFRIAGPGIAAGTEVGGVDDGGGAWRASFTFLQAGRFEVDFLARVDGSPARASRVLVVGASAPPLPAAAASGAAPAPARTSATKWM